jgi:cysteine synthase A
LQENAAVDTELLSIFEKEILGRMPHIQGAEIVNPTPLVDLTQMAVDCAKEEYMLNLSTKKFKVYGKQEASLLGGSVKSRPAVQIAHDAIRSGKLRRGMVVFEATSGNFGISLGLLGSLGFKVVVLVSRRLQEGVLKELDRSSVKAVDLDVDVCPAPGMQMDPNVLLAKVVATNMRERFSEIGLDPAVFDSARSTIEEMLARQDVINLAKVLAQAYGGFCPEQYDNEDNVRAHSTVTGPEIDQQLKALGGSLGDHQIVCTFGTGGTSGGLSRYVASKYGEKKKTVHVVFPPEGQDVAGIRTKSKGAGLRFYEPSRYAGEHEVDFEQAKRLFGYFVRKGVDIGESSALALYAVLQMVNFGAEDRYVVILADGAKKYKKAIESEMREEDREEGMEVTAERAKSRPGRYSEVLWTHMGYVPTDEGRKLIAEQLGVPEDRVKVAAPADVTRLVTAQELTPGLRSQLDGESGRVLLVCMAGNTSLRAANALKSRGLKSQSLTGGITKLAQDAHKPLPALVKPAR